MSALLDTLSAMQRLRPTLSSDKSRSMWYYRAPKVFRDEIRQVLLSSVCLFCKLSVIVKERLISMEMIHRFNLNKFGLWKAKNGGVFRSLCFTLYWYSADFKCQCDKILPFGFGTLAIIIFAQVYIERQKSSEKL